MNFKNGMATVLGGFALAGIAIAVGCTAARADENPDYDPACLTITRASTTTYLIENADCQSKSVLAAIALAGSPADARCFTKKIRTQISIASEQSAPIVYYQCIEGLPGCTLEELHGMFPECRNG